MTDQGPLERARAALAEHAWQEAYESFVKLAQRGQLRAEDLTRYGEAAWWSAHPDESIAAFERAFAAHVSEGNVRRAAFTALRLGFEYADRLEDVLWNGWLHRATRLLADQPECVEQGYLELALTRSSFEGGAIDEAMDHVARVHDIGTRFGDADLVAFALVLHGSALVSQTRLREGLALVDEGTLAAVGGELSPYVAGSIYCITLGVCRAVADYGRAARWTEAAERWCEREAITGFPGICRVQRAEIMRLRGAYAEAEGEAARAVTELVAFGRRMQAGAGACEIGEVRLRLGDLDGAEAAFEQAHQLGRDPQPGLALLELARGRSDAAQRSIATALADATDPLDRARLLAAQVEIALAGHHASTARLAADELEEIAAGYDMVMLQAIADQAAGAARAEEDPEAAVVRLRRSVRRWIELDAPFEAAQARRSLAAAYASAGDGTSAAMELRAARAEFERLGARLDVERCDALLRAMERRPAEHRVVRTFMFTDIVGSTDLVRTIGDESWGDLLRWHDDTLRNLIGSHGGEVVHTTGDGFFAAFGNASAAIACAVAIQRRLAEHRRRHGFAPQVRIGLHSDEATFRDRDYAGLGVHQAARVGALAAGGEILVTASTISSEAIPPTLVNEREVSLKGLDRPVRVASVEWTTSG